MDLAVSLIVLFVLLLFSGFFSGSETALFSLSKVEKRRVEKGHPFFSRILNQHLQHPRRTLVTILIGNILVNILSAAMITVIVLRLWGPEEVSWALAVYTLVLILFGEILPKTLALHNNEKFALWVALPLRFFEWLFMPLRYLTQSAADLILSVEKIKKKEPSDHFSEDELKAMVKIGEEEGMLDRQERYMIQKLFELGERPARDIMTPRIDVKGLDMEDDHEKQTDLIRRYHYTHFPVYRETMDNIMGVVSSQEYMLNLERPLNELMSEPLYVPESKRIDDLLTEFKKKGANFAVCVDEYGGTAGIVTLEDILEEIFGEYYDEYAEVEHPIRSFGPGQYLVEAKIPLSEFNEYFSTHLEAEEASTVGGYIMEKTGEVPSKGKVIQTEECEITIKEVIRKRRIHRVIVRMKER